MSESLTIENIPKSEVNIEVDSSAPIKKKIPPVIENVVEKTKYQPDEQDKLAPQPINSPGTQAYSAYLNFCLRCRSISNPHVS